MPRQRRHVSRRDEVGPPSPLLLALGAQGRIGETTSPTATASRRVPHALTFTPGVVERQRRDVHVNFLAALDPNA
jgi:hypothetical protein